MEEILADVVLLRVITYIYGNFSILKWSLWAPNSSKTMQSVRIQIYLMFLHDPLPPYK